MTVRKAKLGRCRRITDPWMFPLIRSASSPSPTTPRGSCKPSAPDPVATLDYSAYIDQFTPTQQKFIDGLSTVGVFLEVNREAVVAAAPDLIVGDAYEIDEDMFRELSKLLRQRCIRARTDRIGALSPRVSQTRSTRVRR